ncbi:Hint domain-containing protein [Pararhizobium sp. BT-229]|nr:Hint domain-containing protein [Pararhizobium sp. BT-229]MCV9967432.1 Hint domain-containing protein [Pararhizobium sp. BT-229]
MQDHPVPHKGHMCFLRGTSIMIPAGEVCIEHLKIGDLVETIRGKARLSNGSAIIVQAQRSCPGTTVFCLSALHGTPSASTGISMSLPAMPCSSMALLVRAKDLVNGRSVVPALPADQDRIEYFQIVLDSHEAILAEGAAAETFLVAADNYEGFRNFAEFKRLYPPGLRLAMKPFATHRGGGLRTGTVDGASALASVSLPSTSPAGSYDYDP